MLASFFNTMLRTNLILVQKSKFRTEGEGGVMKASITAHRPPHLHLHQHGS